MGMLAHYLACINLFLRENEEFAAVLQDVYKRQNLYGPTEGTIYCTAYRIPVTSCKHHNGMTAIGTVSYTHLWLAQDVPTDDSAS